MKRYNDEEVRRILELAAREPAKPNPEPADASPPAVREERGLTLAELQDVAKEVGLEPSRIATAALALDTTHEAEPRGMFMGTPVTVGRTVDLPRSLTDREWSVLVAELRDTFEARGQVTSHGQTLEWTNGHLQVFVEPTATGTRLRMGTRNETTKPLLSLGSGITGFGAALLLLFIFEGLIPAAVVATLILLAGGSLVGMGKIQPARWADKRERQMEYIASRALTLTSAPAESEAVLSSGDAPIEDDPAAEAP